MAYANIAKALEKEYATIIANQTAYINDADEVDAYRVKSYATETRCRQYDRDVITFSELKQFAIKRMTAQFEKKLALKLEALNKYACAAGASEIEISVEWHKSRLWGYNPVADVRVWGADTYAHETGAASGCGYDKESTAVGEALNKILSMRKLLCDIKERAMDAGVSADATHSNAPFIAYGAGYGSIPYFEGGVGFSCFDNILTSAGYKRVACTSGKTYDYYRYEKADA